MTLSSEYAILAPAKNASQGSPLMLDARHLFPDQSHIDQVRDALWGNYGNGASVMIGSGFSKSALKVRPGIGDPPMLADIAIELHRKLYPDNTESNQQIQTPSSSAADHILSLAQEYVTAFERANLHELLQRLIRDDDLMPSNTHARLLKLPWRDVFTTNWDTLLERTLSQVTNRPYSVVRDMEEIPLAKKPRIVKLHGSLPAQFPLILTEEDYRTYPQEFAPFVNTVQQAMMETVFCLIGFSGNDPNFLNWSGWVRDNLGPSAPRIYLAGWLNLPHHRRRMLERRGVVAVDLARHPRAHTWPEHQRYQYAIDWILHTLEQGRPYDLTYWPAPVSDSNLEVPDYLRPVAQKSSTQPTEEHSIEQQLNDNDLTDSVIEILDIWQRNRQLYPGWLFLPAGEQRETFSRGTDSWEKHILAALPSLSVIHRLNAVHELVWRRKILLQPLSTATESAASEVLTLVDCQNRTIAQITDPQLDWAVAREMWREVALALMTTARLHFDTELFDDRITQLEPFVNDHPEVYHNLHQERCLEAIYRMDFDALANLLEKWVIRDGDPIWMVRKAALFSELNRNDEARELVEKALSDIRSSPDSYGSVAGASREAWAMWSALTRHQRYEFDKRWDELATLKCDAMFEKDFIARQMTSERDSTDAPTFDLGTRRAQGVRFSSFRPDLAAFRAILLTEVAGLPPITRYDHPIGQTVSSDILRSAAEFLVSSHAELAIRLVLRACNSETDHTLNRVLSRTAVANLSELIVENVSNSTISIINYAFPRLMASSTPRESIHWVTRMRVAIEVLSRLAVRSTPDRADNLLDLGLQCYKSREVAQQFWLYDSVRNLLRRSWEALPEERRHTRALGLLGAPIVGMDNFSVSVPDRFTDPGELLSVNDLPDKRLPDNEHQWQEAIAFLLRGLVTDGESRRRSASRILLLLDRGLLTQAESSQVAQALWGDTFTSTDGFPIGTGLFDWAFLLYPQPTSGIAEQRFRQKWLFGDATMSQKPIQGAGHTKTIEFGTRPINPNQAEDVIWNIGAAMSELRRRAQPMQLTELERQYVSDVVEHWVSTPIVSDPVAFFHSAAHEPTRRALQGLSSILHEDVIYGPLGERIYEKLKRLVDSDIPGFEAISGLVKTIPGHVDELANWLRMGLVSENSNRVASAMTGLNSWLIASVDGVETLPPPPDDILREVGLVIAARRSVSLSHALQVARWVFNSGTTAQREIIGPLALHGLRYLSEELRYDREHDSDEDIDVPLLRWLCVQLSQSMADTNLPDPSVIRLWLQLGEEDPLPEVRYAVSSSKKFRLMTPADPLTC